MSKAILLTQTENGVRAVAAAARISTTGGGATAQYASATGGTKDLSLVRKVLASGHHSVFEHQTFFVGFEDVSVAVEQFVIEARLGSYTVKSRRYVDFSHAGYVTPAEMEGVSAYDAHMRSLFALYSDLTEAGVPREDARFVLPYCFCSNFFMTMNARELCRLVAQMVYGRGKAMPEICRLGESLSEQIDAVYPGAVEQIAKSLSFASTPSAPLSLPEEPFRPVTPRAQLLRSEQNAQKVLREALACTGREHLPLSELLRDSRARELEFCTYAFRLEHVSLACVTHFARHRMQSILIPDPKRALSDGGYIVPESIREPGREALLSRYEAAFTESRRMAAQLLQEGLCPENAVYFALAGMTMPLYLQMNARELCLFLRLRTCTRAQWEIRALAREMLAQCREADPFLFAGFGPSCIVLGACPEGRLSCHNPPDLSRS